MNTLKNDRLAVLGRWISERERMRRRRAAGINPCTSDPIMATWRWCNVRRMDDAVSQWLLRYWYTGQRAKPENVVSAAALARLVNLPETLAQLRDVSWGDWDEVKYRLWRRFVVEGQKTFDPAYKIPAGGAYELREKYELVVDIAAAVHARFPTPASHSMRAMWAKLCTIKNLGGNGFIAGQIVADVRHVLPGEWVDRMKWAPMGPGSAKGMAYLLGQDAPVSAEVFAQHFPAVIDEVRTGYAEIWRDRKLEAHDVQNCLCELSKYVRTLNGGKLKQRYAPRQEVRP